MDEQNADSKRSINVDPQSSQPIVAMKSDAMYQVDDQPAFIVGVTGNMDPTAPDAVKERVRCLFRFLRRRTNAQYDEVVANLLSDLVPLVKSRHGVGDQANHHHDEAHADPNSVYRNFFQDWPGLDKIPIVILSSLAPGADQLVAEVVLEPEFKDDDFHLLCPLPFPIELYRQASTFIRRSSDNPTPEEVTADKERLQQLREIVSDDEDERCFTVAIDGDMQLSKADLRQRYEHDKDDRERRHMRYQATGEYIAAYSHIMIAIWDHQYDSDTTVGAAAIVNARRTGLTPGLLPSTSALSLSTDDPTFHIFTKREKRGDCDVACEPSWSTRWLFPKVERVQFNELASASYHSIADNDADWQQRGFSHFVRATQLLNEFCQRDSVDGQRAEKHVRDFLTHDGLCIYDQLAKTSAENVLLKMIRRVADFRRRAADHQYGESEESRRILTTLFWLTLLAALLVGASHHWHPQNVDHSAKHHQNPAELKAPVAEARGQHSGQNVNTAASSEIAHVNRTNQLGLGMNVAAEPDSSRIALETDHTFGSNRLEQSPWPLVAVVVRFAIALLGMAAAGYALLYFHSRRPQQKEAKAEDLRAIAEGARVQMLWHIAGVGQSASANYLQRQRGELSWIRKAIRSVGMPYENARWSFDDLDASLKISLLKCVFHNWLRGDTTNAQSNYFMDKRAEHIRSLHFWHKLGSVHVLAGLILCVVFAIAALADFWHGDWLRRLADWFWGNYLCSLLFFPPIILGWIYWRLRKITWKVALRNYIEPWFEQLIPTTESMNFAHDPPRFSRQMRKNFCAYLGVASVIAFFSLLFCATLQRCAMLPNTEAWLIIVSSGLLAIGGLSIAWSERRLYPEIIYQYGTMAHVFQLSANRVELLIQQLEASHEAEDQACVNKLIREIQQIYFEIGREALDENAEWLILHRARPLEPVLAA